MLGINQGRKKRFAYSYVLLEFRSQNSFPSS